MRIIFSGGKADAQSNLHTPLQGAQLCSQGRDKEEKKEDKKYKTASPSVQTKSQTGNALSFCTTLYPVRLVSPEIEN